MLQLRFSTTPGVLIHSTQTMTTLCNLRPDSFWRILSITMLCKSGNCTKEFSTFQGCSKFTAHLTFSTQKISEYLFDVLFKCGTIEWVCTIVRILRTGEISDIRSSRRVFLFPSSSSSSSSRWGLCLDDSIFSSFGKWRICFRRLWLEAACYHFFLLSWIKSTPQKFDQILTQRKISRETEFSIDRESTRNTHTSREMNPSPLKIAKMELQGLTMLYNTMVQECWSKCIPNTKEVSRFTLIFSPRVESVT